MELQKQPVLVNFRQGLDTKTDPFQVPTGRFLSLINSVFDKLGRLTKRNGFASFSVNPGNSPTHLSTFKGDLIAAGNTVASYESQIPVWKNKGAYLPVDVSVTGLIRNNLNQSQCDSAVSGNISCVTYAESNTVGATTYKYSVLDAVTGQSLVPATALTGTAGSVTGTPRVFLLGSNFIIVFSVTITAVEHLQYIAISATTLSVAAAVDITNSYTSSTMVDWDGVVAGGNLYLAWNGAAASGIKMVYLSSALALSSITNPDPTNTAQVLGMCADTSGGSPVIWAMYQGATGSAYALAVSSTLVVILAATAFDAANTLLNVTGYATAGTVGIVCEISKTYSTFDSTLPRSALTISSVSQAGAVVAPATFNQQMGLASKMFSFNSRICFLAAYSSPYQPTYFLMTTDSLVLATIAYQNGGGYRANGLANVSPSGSSFYIPYLFKDLIESVNKGTNLTSTAVNPVQSGGIYSQTGVNLLAVSAQAQPSSIEFGTNLNLTGGFVWAYDGVGITENGFFLYPELRLNADGTYKGISAYNVPVSPTATTTSGSNTLNSVSSTVGIAVGQIVTGTGIAAGSIVVGFGPASNQVILSLPMTSSGAGRTITFTGNMSAQKYFYAFTYEWTDNQGNAFRSAPSIPVSITVGSGSSSVDIVVPTLPVTYKLTNPVKIVGYRWSAGQQQYYQFTSVLYPTLNPTNATTGFITADTVTITDSNSDATILGNNLLYTTGGVVENTAPPATKGIALFDERFWLIDAEDMNLLEYSKPGIEFAPLEMSDLLTIYVPPVIGNQGNAGGLSVIFPMDDKLILFRRGSIQYINGTGPDITGANSQYSPPILITSSVGSTNTKSVVMTPAGLMFQSQNGFWLLGHDLSVNYIGAEVEAFNSYTANSAAAIPGTTQVRFGMSNGIILMYDYFSNQWGEFTGASSVSSTIYNQLQTIVDGSGNVYQESAGTYYDGANPVLMSFSTNWLNLAGLRGYERAYFFFILGQYLSAHNIRVDVAYDYNSTIVQTKTFTPNLTTNQIEQFRFFFKKQKTKAFQLTLTETYTAGGTAGAGFTLSGLNMQIGFKKGYAPIPATKSIG